MNFPNRHYTHSLEQKSETFFRNHIPQEWVVNRPQHDYGLDFQIGITENGELRGMELSIQLKASKNKSRYKKTEIVQLKVSTYNYLRKLLTVVMLVKFVESENEAYWIFLRDVNPPRHDNQQKITVHIPKIQKLSEIDWTKTIEIVRNINARKLGSING